MVQWVCLISGRLFDVWTLYLYLEDCLNGPVILPCILKTDVWTSHFGIMSQYNLMFYFKINVGHYDLYFMFQWFCLISWRLFDVWTSYFGIELVWPKIWPQNKCRSLWPIFHGPVSLPYILKTIWCMNIVLWDYDSVWPYVWPQNKSRWPAFHGPVILPYILNKNQKWDPLRAMKTFIRRKVGHTT